MNSAWDNLALPQIIEMIQLLEFRLFWQERAACLHKPLSGKIEACLTNITQLPESTLTN